MFGPIVSPRVQNIDSRVFVGNKGQGKQRKPGKKKSNKRKKTIGVCIFYGTFWHMRSGLRWVVVDFGLLHSTGFRQHQQVTWTDGNVISSLCSEVDNHLFAPHKSERGTIWFTIILQIHLFELSLACNMLLKNVKTLWGLGRLIEIKKRDSIFETRR